MHIENIVIGKPIVEPQELLARDIDDWEKIEKPKTYFTEERKLANILKDIGVVPSVSEVRRNKPQFMVTLDKLDCLEVKWGKTKLYIIVGQ